MPKIKFNPIKYLLIPALLTLTLSINAYAGSSFIGKVQLNGANESRKYYFRIPDEARALVGYQTRGNIMATGSLRDADTDFTLSEEIGGLGGSGREDFGTFREGRYYIDINVIGGLDFAGSAEIYFDFENFQVPELKNTVEIDWYRGNSQEVIKLDFKDVEFLETVQSQCPPGVYAIYDPEGNLVSKADQKETSYQSFNLVYPANGVWTIKISEMKNPTPYTPLKFKYHGGNIKLLGKESVRTADEPKATPEKRQKKTVPYSPAPGLGTKETIARENTQSSTLQLVVVLLLLISAILIVRGVMVKRNIVSPKRTVKRAAQPGTPRKTKAASVILTIIVIVLTGILVAVSIKIK